MLTIIVTLAAAVVGLVGKGGVRSLRHDSSICFMVTQQGTHIDEV